MPSQVKNLVELEGKVVWSAEKELEKTVMHAYIIALPVPNQKFTHNFICKKFAVTKKDKLFAKGTSVNVTGSLQINSWKTKETDKEYQREVYVRVDKISEIEELPF